jgi:ankyrin repeat protein
MVMPIHLQRLDASPDIDMVRLLLEQSADPNQSIYIYDRQTVWSLFLHQCYNTTTRGNPHQSNMYELFQVLIEGGANPNISFKTTDNEVITISDVLKRMLRESEVTRLNELLAKKLQSRFSVWRLQGILGVGARK